MYHSMIPCQFVLEIVFYWVEVTFITTGNYVDTISVTGSCDSMLNTSLTVYPVSI